MSYTIKEIAAALGAEVFGAADLEVTEAAEPADAGPDQLALAMKPDYAEDLAKGAAQAAILWDGANWQSFGLKAAITVARSRCSRCTPRLVNVSGSSACWSMAAFINSSAVSGSAG